VVQAKNLPEQFTEQDGTGYRRLGAATLSFPQEKTVSITVPVTGRPLDIVGVCEGETTAVTSAVTIVDGKPGGRQMSLLGCDRDRRFLPIEIPEGAREMTLRFEAQEVRQAGECESLNPTTRCKARTDLPAKSSPGVWTLAVYEWTPPAEPVLPAPPRDFPQHLDDGGESEYRLLERKSGTWPLDRTVTFEATVPGATMGIEQLCSGALAGRLRFTFRVDGEDSGSTMSCVEWVSGDYPLTMSQFQVPKSAGRVTVEIIWQMPGGFEDDYAKRPVRWSIGLYEMTKGPN
jgi:hypothetical protein